MIKNFRSILKYKTKKNSKESCKGYIISLAVVTILLILSILAINIITSRYAEYSILRNQLFADKVAFAVNDILMDVKKVLSVSQSANSSIVTITENYSYVKSSFLLNEQDRLNEFANITGLNISFIPPSPSSVVNITFTNGMTYLTNESDQNNKEVSIYNSSGNNLNLTGYTIYIRGSQNKNIKEISTTPGTLQVSITSYNTQIGQSSTSTYSVDGSAVNVWRINAPSSGQNVSIVIGNINGKTNSLQIRQYNTNAINLLVTNISMQTKDDVEGEYNILINISSPTSTLYDFLKIR